MAKVKQLIVVFLPGTGLHSALTLIHADTDGFNRFLDMVASHHCSLFNVRTKSLWMSLDYYQLKVSIIGYCCLRSSCIDTIRLFLFRWGWFCGFCLCSACVLVFLVLRHIPFSCVCCSISKWFCKSHSLSVYYLSFESISKFLNLRKAYVNL